jgi:hypothetical protein
MLEFQTDEEGDPIIEHYVATDNVPEVVMKALDKEEKQKIELIKCQHKRFYEMYRYDQRLLWDKPPIQIIVDFKNNRILKLVTVFEQFKRT